MSRRICVLVSGNGSNLQALIDACESGEIDATIQLVLSNRAEAFGLERARANDIDAVHLPVDGRERSSYDELLAKRVAASNPDWVVLAGWMRILTMSFLGEFPSMVVNLHPALPGMFAGTHAIERAFDAYRAGHIDHTGVMTHLVPDEQVDAGPVLETIRVDIEPNDELFDLEARMHESEHELIVTTMKKLCEPDR